MTNVIVCCDGLDPDYLNATDTPGWDEISDEGRSGICLGTIPSLTNVNNVGIVTGSYPDRHGITGNTYYDREHGECLYMNNPSLIQCETQLQAAARRARVGLLVVKNKLQQLIGQGCTVSVSAEKPPRWLENRAGPAPDIYSGETSPWLFQAATIVLEECRLDWLYVATTDVVPHKHAPADDTAIEWVTAMDEGLAIVYERADEMVITADHGMSQKTLCIDVERYLADLEYDATTIPLIRDTHTYHHQNLGGAAYVYLTGDADEVAARLVEAEGIDLVLPRGEAAERFHLPPNRIGDLVLLGSADAVFGPVDSGTHAEVNLRSHGSHHERNLPYATTADRNLSTNLDAFSVLQ